MWLKCIHLDLESLSAAKFVVVRARACKHGPPCFAKQTKISWKIKMKHYACVNAIRRQESRKLKHPAWCLSVTCEIHYSTPGYLGALTSKNYWKDGNMDATSLSLAAWTSDFYSVGILRTLRTHGMAYIVPHHHLAADLCGLCGLCAGRSEPLI